MKLYQHLPPSFLVFLLFLLFLLICVLLSGCVCSLWQCFQCWELCNFVLHRFLYMFLQQHPSALKSVALPQCTQPEIPSGRESPADCLPKEQKRGQVSSQVNDFKLYIFIVAVFICFYNFLASEPNSNRVLWAWTCQWVWKPYWRNPSLYLILHPSLNVF